jgi:hypothetical protein
MQKPLIIQLTNELHRTRDPDSKPVKDFIAKHSHDEVFMKRAKTLVKLFKLKSALVK